MEQPYGFEKTIEYKGIKVPYRFDGSYYYLQGFSYGFLNKDSARQALGLKLEAEKAEEFKKRERSIKRVGIEEGIHNRGKAIASLERDMKEWQDK